MWAPKRPLATATWEACAPASSRSNTRRPISGIAAPLKLGRKPLRVSAASVNCGTSSRPPAVSRSLARREVMLHLDADYGVDRSALESDLAVRGDVVWGALVAASGSPRAGLAVVLALTVLGAGLLLRVDEPAGVAASGRASAPPTS